MIYHYKLAAIMAEVFESPALEKLEPHQVLMCYFLSIFGLIHSFKEFIISLTSLTTGTTVQERQRELSAPYFKTRLGVKNPFNKVK